MLASPEALRSPRPSALDASEAVTSSFAAAFGTLSGPEFGLGLGAAVESCPWADHQVEPYLPPSPPPRPASPPSRPQPSELLKFSEPSDPAAVDAADNRLTGGAEMARGDEGTIPGENRLAPSPSTGSSTPSAVAEGGGDYDAPESDLRIAAPVVLDEVAANCPGHTAAEDGPFDGGTEDDDLGDGRDRRSGAEEGSIGDSPGGGAEEGNIGDGRDVATEKSDAGDGRDIAAEDGDTGDGGDIAAEDGDTGDGRDTAAGEGHVGDIRDIATEEGDTGDGGDIGGEEGYTHDYRDTAAEICDTADGRNVATEEGDTGDGRDVFAKEVDIGDGREIGTEEGDTGYGRDIAAEEGDTSDGRVIAGEERDTNDGRDIATDEGDTGDKQDNVAEEGVTIDDCNAKDEDADDYASCFTGTPSPESLSPMPCDKEADGESDGAYEDFDFDDFASCVDEYDFGDCSDSFESFASARASLSVTGTEDYTRILESLSVAEVDFQRLTGIVLGSAYWFTDPLPKPSPCCDVEFPGSWRNATHQVSDSDRLGGDGCVELLACLTSASPLAKPSREASAGFDWKSSVLCSLFSAAANPSRLVEDRLPSPLAPAASGSPRLRGAPRTRGAIDGTRRRVSRPSASAENEGTPRSSVTAGSVPGSTSPQPTGSASAAASTASHSSANGAAASPAKSLDLAHVRRLCGVSKAALMKRRAEELSLLRDHYAKVLESATSHLRLWLDDKEQADMRSEMNHKIIETLVLEAQKAVSEKSTVHGDVKRRKVASVRTPRKPPKVEQGEQAVGLRVRLPL